MGWQDAPIVSEAAPKWQSAPIEGAVSDSPPEGAVPGSREYAQWAMEQARAGKSLPQVGEHDAGWEERNLSPDGQGGVRVKRNSLGDKLTAAAGSYIEGAPIIGPAWLDATTNLASWLRNDGTTADEMKANLQELQQDNPITAGAAGIGSSVLNLAPLAATAVGGRLLGASGNMASQTVMGGLSGGALSFADTLARGGSTEDAATSGLWGLGVGMIAPWAIAGAGKAIGAATGRNTPKSVQNVARALSDDAIDPAAASAQLAELGPDAMLMDLGPNLQSQAGALAATPGPGQKIIRDAVTSRSDAAAKSARVTDDVSATVGQGPDIDLLKEQIVSAQKAAADPLYDAVRDVPLPIAGGFQFVLQTPMGREAFRQAGKFAANDGKQVNGLTVGLVDYAKQALDDIAKEAGRKGKNNLARQAGNLARLLRTETDKVVPGYKLAREAFAGPAAVMDAVDAGAGVFAKDLTPSQLERNLKSMTTGERLAFLDGARSHIESQLGNAVNDALSLRNMFKKGWNEQKLRIILGDQVADDLMKRINREALFAKTASVVEGNSETARRAASMGEVSPDAKNLSQIGVVGLFLQALNKAAQKIAGYGQKKINAQMADMLTSGQISPELAKRLQAVIRGKGPNVIAPAGVADAVAVEDKRQPVEIVVTGGNPALSAAP